MEQRRLRLLSYNIQSGLSTDRYSHYVTNSWKHLLPVPSRMKNLDGIARILKNYDLVALQEVDGGSLRTGFVDQISYLAERAQFPYVIKQSNRRFGLLAQHSSALLSRLSPSQVDQHRLPGRIPGRGLMWVRFGDGDDALHLGIMHLALGRRDRLQQFDFLVRLIGACRHVVVMGDMNCRSNSPEMRHLLNHTRLREPANELYTFPSWQPSRQLDHILVSDSLAVEDICVLTHTFSDHLPIAMRALLPVSPDQVA